MAKKIYKAGNVRELDTKVLIKAPYIKRKEPENEPEEMPDAVEAVKAPPAPEREVNIEEEKNDLLEEARALKADAEKESVRIRGEAEEYSERVKKEAEEEALGIKAEAEVEKKALLDEAGQEAVRLKEEAAAEAERILGDARENAVREGREEGYREGKEEAGRLIDQLHEIINAALDKRGGIIEDAEIRLVELVLLVSRKVVGVLSNEMKDVVLVNVKKALEKVKGETEITIKVNMRDLDLTTKHKKAFITAVQGLKQVKVVEDTRVDPGGCVIETSFGDVDARIVRQLGVIEERIRELIPLKG